jgi:hypothetical protein
MDSRVAVQTAALRARGAVYVKAGAAMTELVGGGSAFRIAHQLVDIVETGRETSLEVGDLVALANNKVPSLRPIFNLFVSKDAVAFYTLITALITVLMFFGVRQDESGQPQPHVDIDIVIQNQFTELQQVLIQIHERRGARIR